VHLRLERQGAIVAACIRDNGRGFDVQASAGYTGPDRGTGLVGIRERVTAMGGHLHVESRAKKGTTLLIEIPVGS
jgi:two-component system sensor histidine kinase UhpB